MPSLLLLLALLAQVPEGAAAPIVEEPVPAPAAALEPVVEPAPVVEATPIVEPVPVPAVVPAAPTTTAPTTTTTTPTTAPTTTTTTTTTPSGFERDHLLLYGPEYAAVATIGVLYLAGVHKLIPPGPALIGPRFDPGDPDLQLLFDPRLDDVIGRPFTNEKVSNGALTIGAFSVIALTSLADFFTADDLHHTHAVALGAVETLAGTVLVVEALKPLVGRLRPDYRDRFVHAACGGTIAVPAGLDCAGVDNSFTVDADDLRDGQKSFASGHAATSFAMATYASWWLGTKLVWAKDAPAWGPAVGSLGIGSLMSVAGFVSASRLNDNRHHPEDVVVGAALGAGIASALWFTHLDLDGRARRRGAADDDAVSVEVAPALGMGSTGTGTGLALVATLP